MQPLAWSVQIQLEEDGLPRVYPSGFFRFMLRLHDAETKVYVGNIDGFQGFIRDRAVFSIHPPVTRGARDEVYYFVNICPEWLGLIRDAVQEEFQRLNAARKARHEPLVF